MRARTLGGLIGNAAQRFSHHTALPIHGQARLDYAELAARGQRVAAAAKPLGAWDERTARRRPRGRLAGYKGRETGDTVETVESAMIEKRWRRPRPTAAMSPRR